MELKNWAENYGFLPLLFAQFFFEDAAILHGVPQCMQKKFIFYKPTSTNALKKYIFHLELNQKNISRKTKIHFGAK
jgi:hypothetical protein